MTGPVTVWTIGHSTLPIESFQALLETHAIAALADVRRFPGSRRLPQFNRDALEAALRTAGVSYEPFPELGGRRQPRPDSPNTAWRNAAFRGYADFMDTSEFPLAIDRLLSLAGERRTAVMCAEALWWRCHRALIADYLAAAGHQVLHIGTNGAATAHRYTSAARVVDGRLSYAADDQHGLALDA
jgi:uncharacterized protein (DUF488 family)